MKNAELGVSLETEGADMPYRTCLTAIVPGYGQYKFWIANGDRVAAIEIKKSKGDFLLNAKKQMKVIGAADDGQGSKTQLVGFEARVNNIQYDENGFPSSFDLLHKSSTSDGKELELPNRIEIGSVSAMNWGFTEDLHFKVNHVAEGIRVDVEGHEGEAYEFRNGKITRIFDSESIGEIDGVRFRKSQGHFSYYLTIVASILVILGVLYYARRHAV